MTIKRLEDFVKNNLNIPNVNFSGLKLEAVEEIVEALTLVIKKYPALSNSICSIGPSEDINNQFNLVSNSKIGKKIEWEDFVVDTCVMSAVCLGGIPILKKNNIIDKKRFIGIAYSNLIVNKDVKRINFEAIIGSMMGIYHQHCKSIKNFVYHEIGHVLDFILDFSGDKNLEKIVRNINGSNFNNLGKKVSSYATNSIADLIAESFAEYFVCPDSNELIKAIGEYIDQKYKIFENSTIFMINQKFSKKQNL